MYFGHRYKLLKLAKIFSCVSIIGIFNNRLLFTKHGLHLNESGKELLPNQLVLHIFSVLEEVSVNPITLGWNDKNLQVNASSITRSSHTLTHINCQLPTAQASKCTKKLPVTRKYDFFMGNLTEESEFGRVINCNELKHNKNQNQVRNIFIPKFSKKRLLFFSIPLEVSTAITLMNYPFL